MDGRLPLPTLLSRALVAFIIEFDNEFERQMPHRTTNHGATPGVHDAPWLVSMVMWSKFMRFIPDQGMSVRELQALLKTNPRELKMWLTRLGKWWGYLELEADFARPTTAGCRAQEIWRPLASVIERRWEVRFGGKNIDHLRESLSAVVGQLDDELPDSLPILGYGLFSTGLDQAGHGRDLSSLLSKVLLAFALEFESVSEVSLAICANVLRLIGEESVRVRDLPRLASVSKEAIATSVSFLEKRGYADVKPGKVIVLSAKGRSAREAYYELLTSIEKNWETRFGRNKIRNLRKALEQLEGELLRGLELYKDGWRAALPKLPGLPHYPMILHRGGFPDGS
jgi:hypothetical protein